MTNQRQAHAVYLDHAATSPMYDEVWAAMAEARDAGFNPVSAHAFGRRAHERLEDARAELAELLGCHRREIYFTAGGTESDNLAILGFVRAQIERRPCIVLSEVEHMACLEAARRGAAEGAEIRWVPVDASATVRLPELEAALDDTAGRPTLVSIMWANNEVGTVQPMADIARLAHERGALLHSDAVQAFGKEEVSVGRVPVDLLTATAHKLGGPVGIGLLVCRQGVELQPLTFGGSQEKGLWPGTQNPTAAVGFACAARLAVEERDRKATIWRQMRDRLAARLTGAIPGLIVHAAEAEARLPNLLSVGLPGCDPGALLLSLDLEGVAVSGGSACSSGSASGSHVLSAMGIGAGEEYATVRFSFGPYTTEKEVERAAEAMIRSASRVAAQSRAGAP